MPIQVNDTIILKNNLRGTIKYIGHVDGKPDEWVGIELEVPKGTNNGTVDGVSYFRCRENHGLFVKYRKLTRKITNMLEDEGASPAVIRDDYSIPEVPWNLTVSDKPECGPPRGEAPGPVSLFREDKKEDFIKKYAEALSLIQQQLENLQRKIEDLNRSYKIRKEGNERERDLVISLVSGMIEMERNGDKKGIEDLFVKFKGIMSKYKINTEYD